MAQVKNSCSRAQVTVEPPGGTSEGGLFPSINLTCPFLLLLTGLSHWICVAPTCPAVLTW